MIGLAFAEYALVCIILFYWKAGGVKHASEIESGHRGKTADVGGGTMERDRVEVQVRNLHLTWFKRGGRWKKRSESPASEGKVILDDISLTFPAGEVSAILVSYFHCAPSDELTK